MRSELPLAATALVASASACITPVGAVDVPVELASPAPTSGALFGQSTLRCDFDHDGKDDIAVGAPGEGAVYVFYGPDFSGCARFAPATVQAGDLFGYDLAAGPIDAAPGDELVIGAPGRDVGGQADAGAVFLLSHGASPPQRVAITPEGAARLGTSVATGDFDGDGTLDLAAGAPGSTVQGERAGAVVLHSASGQTTWRVGNPSGPRPLGNYGHDLVAADANGDGKTDLFVSALGNPCSHGVAPGGQVFVHLGPVPGGGQVLAEDPQCTAADTIVRFGMSIDARDQDGDGRADLLVGAPRKDVGGVVDAGMGFLFRGPDFQANGAMTFVRPGFQTNDILGYRTVVANATGDGTRDVVLASLSQHHEPALIVWDGRSLGGAPIVLTRPDGGSHHYIRGLSLGGPAARGLEALIQGDPNFARGLPDEGRVLTTRLKRTSSSQRTEPRDGTEPGSG